MATAVEKKEEMHTWERRRNFFLGGALAAAILVPGLTVPALIATGVSQGIIENKRHGEKWRAKLKTIFSAKNHHSSHSHGGH